VQRSNVDFQGFEWAEKGKLTVNETRKCSFDSCPDPAVTLFAQQGLCLRHFLFPCYEDLDRMLAHGRETATS
jgi:hypothetical protein